MDVLKGENVGKWPANYNMSQRPELGKDGKVRFVLAKKKKTTGETLIAFGMNTSTATKLEDDPTLRNLDIISQKKYDNWVMLNVFPFREAKSKNLRDLIEKKENEGVRTENQKEIESVLKEYPHADILLGWSVRKESWFNEEKKKIKKLFENSNRSVFVVDNPNKFNKCGRTFHFDPIGLNNSINKSPEHCEVNDIILKQLTQREINRT